MSRERARRRAARVAEEERRWLLRERAQRRRARWSRVRPAAGAPARRRRRSARPWTRRTRRQRATVVGAVVGAQAVVWLLSASWPVRVAALLLALVAVPALATLTFDRSR